MKNKLRFLFFLFIIINYNCQAQFNKIEFHFEPAGTIQYSQYGDFKALNDFSINYQKYLGTQTYGILGLQGKSRKYNDNCQSCLDNFVISPEARNFAGTLSNKQWMAFAGVRYLFKEEMVRTFNYYIQTTFHYTRFNSQANYSRGAYYDEVVFYNRFKGVGFGLNVGSLYQFFSPWHIGANLGYYFSAGRAGSYSVSPPPPDTYQIEELLDNETLSKFAIEITLGYRFLTKD